MAGRSHAWADPVKQKHPWLQKAPWPHRLNTKLMLPTASQHLNFRSKARASHSFWLLAPYHPSQSWRQLHVNSSALPGACSSWDDGFERKEEGELKRLQSPLHSAERLGAEKERFLSKFCHFESANICITLVTARSRPCQLSELCDLFIKWGFIPLVVDSCWMPSRQQKDCNTESFHIGWGRLDGSQDFIAFN